MIFQYRKTVKENSIYLIGTFNSRDYDLHANICALQILIKKGNAVNEREESDIL